MKGMAVLLGMAIVCMMAFKPASAMSCGDIDVNLSECMWYLAGRDGNPSIACCNGVRHLAKLIATSGDKRVACDCLRERVKRMHGISNSLVNSLPSKCSAKLSYVMSLDHCDGLAECNSDWALMPVNQSGRILDSLGDAIRIGLDKVHVSV